MQVVPTRIKTARPADAEIAARLASLQSGMDALQAENDALKQQLDWFKRQLFGRKSEKRLIDNPGQLGLADVLGKAPAAAPGPATKEITYTRRKGKQRGDDCVTDAGLRFDERVPVSFANRPLNVCIQYKHDMKPIRCTSGLGFSSKFIS